MPRSKEGGRRGAGDAGGLDAFKHRPPAMAAGFAQGPRILSRPQTAFANPRRRRLQIRHTGAVAMGRVPCGEAGKQDSPECTGGRKVPGTENPAPRFRVAASIIPLPRPGRRESILKPAVTASSTPLSRLAGSSLARLTPTRPKPAVMPPTAAFNSGRRVRKPLGESEKSFSPQTPCGEPDRDGEPRRDKKEPLAAEALSCGKSGRSILFARPCFASLPKSFRIRA